MAKTFDVTPDPKVLVALARTPLQPLDALCELLDNSIDSFQAASLRGSPVEHPLIAVRLPKLSELHNGAGSLQIRDNGPGMNEEQTEKAIRVGFSGNNPYDTLGLFGMGFNIATAKLGRVTTIRTGRLEAESLIQTTIDLASIQRLRTFAIPFEHVSKPASFACGTELTVGAWWPDGDANAGFVRKLIQYGAGRIRTELGRRYATILRSKVIRIVVNDEAIQPFEHCVWSHDRYVERKGHGRVPAVLALNSVLGTQRRCSACTALVQEDMDVCPECSSVNIRALEERVTGWVGIQRFDDPTQFGIDLIRNGRAIRIGEQEAFFTFTDEFKRTVKDYPIDSPFGRIVGEIHLDHVPVDFLKQDFQRSTPEWARAVSYVRGNSSLQPSLQGSEPNRSPVSRLYQGYRRVRTPGTADLYMGYWDPIEDKPVRIDRETERAYYDRFLKREPGYYDDSEWWKLVEQATHRPLRELLVCSACGAQNLQEREQCDICGEVLQSKSCVNPECDAVLPRSAASCDKCGTSQFPEIRKAWQCNVCRATNGPDSAICASCGEKQGVLHSLSSDELLAKSHRSDELSRRGLSIALSDGSYSQPIDVDVFVTQEPMHHPLKDHRVAAVVTKGEKVTVFLDPSHPMFASYRVRPEDVVSFETALYLYDSNRRLLAGDGATLHSLSHIAWSVLQSWRETLEASDERLREEASVFWKQLRETLPEIIDHESVEFYGELTAEEQGQLAANIVAAGHDLSSFAELKSRGKYLSYLPVGAVLRLFDHLPQEFFDGRFWSTPYLVMPELPEEFMNEERRRLRALFGSALRDAADLVVSVSPDPLLRERARSSLAILRSRQV